MIEYLLTVMSIIGMIICIVGGCFFGLFGFMVLYELVGDEFQSLKFRLERASLARDREHMAVNHLEKLKKKYPELEIYYKYNK